MHIIFAIILIIARLVLVGYGDALITRGIFYVIMFVVTYLLSTKYSSNKNTWILLIICAVISIIVTHGMFAIVFAILLLVCANDMRKELD